MTSGPSLDRGDQPVRLALVGCGAIGVRAHLPAIARLPGAEASLVVDADPKRARAAARSHGTRAATDYREVPGHAEAAIVAVPNHLHAPITERLLREGVHVLVEKPMAPSLVECRTLNRVATESGAVLAVGLVRRFYGSTGYVRELIRAGPLGRLRRFTVREGTRYRWPVTTGFPFRREEAGGGVLADIGVHVLDLLTWWLGECVWLRYRDDARGGVEAECEIDLRFADGGEGTVLLSRLRDLPGLCRLEFERGTLELAGGVTVAPRVRLALAEPGESDAWLEGFLACEARPRDTVASVYERQLEDFVRAVRERWPPRVPGSEGALSVALVERCYARRTPLVHPWEGVEETRSAVHA